MSDLQATSSNIQIEDGVSPIYIGTEAAAKFLDTKPSVVRSSRHTGNLFGRKPPKHYKIGQRKVIYKIADLIDWIESSPQGHVVAALKTPEQTESKAQVSAGGKIRLAVK